MVGPVRSRSLTSALGRVKRRAGPVRARPVPSAALIQPIKKTRVAEDRFYYLGASRGVRLPNFMMPRLMNNHGNYVGSLGNVARYLGRRAGLLTGLLRDLREVPSAGRAAFGKAVNDLKAHVEEALEAAQARLVPGSAREAPSTTPCCASSST